MSASEALGRLLASCFPSPYSSNATTMKNITFELSECEAIGLLSVLEAAEDLPLSVGAMQRRLLALSQNSNASLYRSVQSEAITAQQDVHAETSNEAQYIGGE